MTEFPEIKWAKIVCITHLNYGTCVEKEDCLFGVSEAEIKEERESVRAWAGKLAEHLRFSTSKNTIQVKNELLRVAEEKEAKK